MPFKKDTAAIAATNAQIAENLSAPLSKEGLNCNNLGNFELSPISSTEEAKRNRTVDTSLLKTQQSTQNANANAIRLNHKTPQEYGLRRPVVEDIPKPSQEMTPLDIKICELVVSKIWEAVCYLRLGWFFAQPLKGEMGNLTPQQRLQEVVNRATRHDYQLLMELHNIPSIEEATDVCVCSLFDYCFVLDDSTSMRISGNRDMMGHACHTEDYDPEEGALNDMTRWEVQSNLVKHSAQTMQMFDSDGISIRMLNQRYLNKDKVTSMDQIEDIFRAKPNGGTNIGAAIRDIAENMIYPKLTRNELEKPMVIVIYTDGVSSDNIIAEIKAIRRRMASTEYGSKSVLFIFNQIGNDQSASDALDAIDTEEDNPADAENGAGDITDTTSNYKKEKAQYDAAQLKVNPELRTPYNIYFHILKGWIGPAMRSYDLADEKR